MVVVVAVRPVATLTVVAFVACCLSVATVGPCVPSCHTFVLCELGHNLWTCVLYHRICHSCLASGVGTVRCSVLRTPTTDLHLDAVWALATKRDPATQLDLCEQRSKTTLEGTVAQKRFRTVTTKYLARPLSRRRIQTVRPPYEKVQVPNEIFPVDTGSARGILPVGITAIWSEGAEGLGALGHTSGCHWVSSDSPVLLIHEGS